MPTVDLNLSNANTAASDKLSAFTQSARVKVSGQKTAFSQVPAFYLGGAIKEHFPYKRDESGKKIEKKGSDARYTEYEKEAVSDGWQTSLRTPGKDALYFVTEEKPTLEVGSFYLVSGLGYGNGPYPTFLDESIVLEKAGQLELLPSYETVLKED